MEKISVAICDDEIRECKYLEDLIYQCIGRNNAEIYTYKNGIELYTALEQKNRKFSIIFLDIYLDEEHGIDVATRIRQIDDQVPIVFTTTSREFAVEAFSVRALHYLVKPVSESSIREVFQFMQSKKDSRPFIEVRQGRDEIRVLLENIRYLQSENKVTHIITNSGDLILSCPLKEIETGLGHNFLKIQRGLIVNMNYIHRMTADSCILKDGRTVLLSRANRSNIRQMYKEYIYNKTLRE